MREKKRGFRNPELWECIATNARNEIQTGGWYSSFDGKPFSEEEMKQYIDNT